LAGLEAGGYVDRRQVDPGPRRKGRRPAGKNASEGIEA